MKKKIIRLAIIIAILSIPVFFFATGMSYVPVGVSLGPCLMDYTSPQTYMGKRPSPLKEERFNMGDGEVLICYGSPSARSRTVFGGIVEYNSLWRFGANEPTRLYTNTDMMFGDLPLQKGRYSIYATVQENEWELFVSTSTNHWGNWITQDVRDLEIGSIKVPVDSTAAYVESFTIESIGNTSDQKELIISWEQSKLVVPISN